MFLRYDAVAEKGARNRGAPGARRTPWLAHGLGLLSAVLLLVAGVGWLVGGAEPASERTGVALDGAASRSLAQMVGWFKGLLDVWPVPLAPWFAWGRQYGAAAATWMVAVLVIPMADLAAVLLTGGPGGAAIHLIYIAAMGGAAFAYAAHTA